MTQRVLGPTGSPRRRWTLILPLVAAFAVGLLYVAGAQAVHDVGVFQLDRNASTAVQSTPAAAEDWDLICKAHPSTCTFASGYAVPSGTTVADPSQHVVDPSESSTDDILKGGTKDDNPISSWKWASAKPSPPKNDITHAFAAEYTCGGSESNSVSGCTGNTGDKLLYFGADRFSNSGSANLAFWFFNHKITQKLADGTTDAQPGQTCSLGAGCIFGGTHKEGEVPHNPNNVGDILIISAFGPKAQIQVYEWVGVGNAPAPCFTNACSLVPLIPASAGQACEDVTTDNACATVNASAGVTSPWTLSQKNAPANQFDATNFFEGGLNLTNLGLANACFSTFLLNTRASAAGDAELHDKVIGQFGRCGASLSTNRGATSSFEIGGSITDSATVSVTGTGVAPTGDVSFFVCGPPATSCSTSGTAFDTKPLSGAVHVGNDFTVTSASYTPTSAGTYCFAASWPGDSNYTEGPYRDDGTNECFTVTPKTPTISTQVSDAGPVVPGTAISDTATLGNTATPSNATNGTITFRAYGPDDATCATVVYTSVANVTGNGTYNSFTDGNGGAFAPTSPGTYRWRAFYAPASGDVNNVAVSTPCNDANESFVVEQFQPSMSTAQTWTVKDSATVTVTGGGNLAGSVTFELHKTSNCSDAATDTQTKQVSGASPQTVSTDVNANTTFTTSQPTLYWKVSYASTNGAHKNIAATCTENSSVTIDNG